MPHESANTNQTDQYRHRDQPAPETPSRRLHWGSLSFAAAGVLFIGYGLTFLYRSFYGDGFELGVLALGGTTRAQLAAANPGLLAYVDPLHVNIAGLMLPVGIAMITLAWYGIRCGDRWAFVTTVALPVVFLAFSLSLPFTGGFSYHALPHMGPTGPGALLLLVGAVLTYPDLRATS